MYRYWEVMSNNIGNKIIYRVGRKLRYHEPLAQTKAYIVKNWDCYNVEFEIK